MCIIHANIYCICCRCRLLKPPYRQRPGPSPRARLPPQRSSNPSSHPATPYPAPAQAQSVFSSVYLLTQSPSRLMSSLATRAVLSTAGFRQIVPKSECFVTHLMPSSFVLSDSISLQHIFSGIVGHRAQLSLVHHNIWCSFQPSVSTSTPSHASPSLSAPLSLACSLSLSTAMLFGRCGSKQ